MKEEDLLKAYLAADYAKCGEFKHKVGAVTVDKKGRILSVGYNKKKTHPKMLHLAKYVGENESKIYLHAEIDALIRTTKPVDTIYVVRINKRGQFLMARPCKICMQEIKHRNIRRIVYSTNNGLIEEYND